MTAVRRRAVSALVLTILFGLLVAFGWRVDWRAAAAAVRRADMILLIVALLLNQLSLIMKGVRWWVFLRPLGVHSLPMVLRATYAGASLNNLLVAQAGEGARVVLVSRASGVSSACVAAALALERVLDAVTYLVLLVLAGWMLHLPPVIARYRTAASLGLMAAVVALTVLGTRTPRRRSRPRERRASRLRSYRDRFVSSVSHIASPSRLGVAMLLSLNAWALQVATYHLVARAAHLPISLAGSVSAMLAIGFSFLLRATPGNIGIFQVVYALTARSFGIAEAPAVAVALLIQSVQVLPTVLLGTLLTHGVVARERQTARLAAQQPTEVNDAATPC